MADLALPDIDLDQLPDASTRQAVQGRLNLGEAVLAENRALREENQRLRDEVQRLKGAPGRPRFPAPRKPVAAAHASERERRQPPPRQMPSKRQHLVLHRTEDLAAAAARLPADAEFKGDEPGGVQDGIFRTDKGLLGKEKGYSPAAGQT